MAAMPERQRSAAEAYKAALSAVNLPQQPTGLLSFWPHLYSQFCSTMHYTYLPLVLKYRAAQPNVECTLSVLVSALSEMPVTAGHVADCISCYLRSSRTANCRQWWCSTFKRCCTCHAQPQQDKSEPHAIQQRPSKQSASSHIALGASGRPSGCLRCSDATHGCFQHSCASAAQCRAASGLL